MTSTWEPLFTRQEAEPYWRSIHAIADRLSRADLSQPTLEWYWSECLLCAYLAHATSSMDRWCRVAQVREQIERLVSELPFSGALYSGTCGVGWLLTHLDSLMGGSDPIDCSELDTLLMDINNFPYGMRVYDLISGSVGRGVYFLERMSTELGPKGLERCVELVEQAAEVDGDEARWFTPPEMLPPWQREQAPQGYYNLGVAHGAPGAIGLLAEAVDLGLGGAGLKTLLAGATNWITRQRLSDGLFPGWIGSGITPRPGRTAWCYGELGLSLPLIRSAQVLKDAALLDTALDVAMAAATRRDVDRVMDAALCHGAAGNGHLFNRLYHATGKQAFREASRFWLARALSMSLKPTEGIGGFRSWAPVAPDQQRNADPWSDDGRFLSGAGGIGLAFLAAVSDTEPNWDRLLLANLNPIDV